MHGGVPNGVRPFPRRCHPHRGCRDADRRGRGGRPDPLRAGDARKGAPRRKPGLSAVRSEARLVGAQLAVAPGARPRRVIRHRRLPNESVALPLPQGTGCGQRHSCRFAASTEKVGSASCPFTSPEDQLMAGTCCPARRRQACVFWRSRAAEEQPTEAVRRNGRIVYGRDPGRVRCRPTGDGLPQRLPTRVEPETGRICWCRGGSCRSPAVGTQPAQTHPRHSIY